jgi:hypothetical protein
MRQHLGFREHLRRGMRFSPSLSRSNCDRLYSAVRDREVVGDDIRGYRNRLHYGRWQALVSYN